MINKEIHIYTHTYPYGSHETFFKNELETISSKFKIVHLYPVIKGTEIDLSSHRDVPENVIVHLIKITENNYFNLFKNLLSFIYYFIMDLILDSNHRVHKIKNIKVLLGYFSISLNIKKEIEKHILKTTSKSIYYSFWMSETALALSMLKRKNKITKFIFKCHRYDVYNEEQKHGFIPFRAINYHYADKIITISKKNKEYIENLYPFVKNKINMIYMGSDDYSTPPFIKRKEYLIFSTSNVIPLKRVEYIPKVLKNIKNINIHWVHAGDGISKDIVLSEAETLPPNIKYTYLGRLPHKDIYNFYLKNNVDLFIHLSTSEGLPISMMEAISFGVPIIACDVGGVSEIVTYNTGFLIPKEFDMKDVANKVKIVLTDGNFDRKEIRKYWCDNFNHERNSKKLLEILAN